MDFIPGVSQLKSAVQVASGDYEGGKETQDNFLVGCPVVSQLVSAAETAVLKDRESALKRQIKFLKVAESALDSVPVVGHIKGGVHYWLGDAEKSQISNASATRSSGVIAGGAVGLVSGGPAGAVIGGVTGGIALDGAYTYLQSRGEKVVPAGTLAVMKSIREKRGKEPVAGDMVDLIGGVILDGITGGSAAALGPGLAHRIPHKTGVFAQLTDSPAVSITEASRCNLNEGQPKKERKEVSPTDEETKTADAHDALRRVRSSALCDVRCAVKKLKRSKSCGW